MNEGKYCDQRDKQIKKWTIGIGDLRARSHPDKFPICGKELKKSLEPLVVVLAFNPSPQKAETGGSPSSRPAWSTEQVTGQPSLGSEGDHQKQKVGEDVPAPELLPHGFGFRVKDRRKVTEFASRTKESL